MSKESSGIGIKQICGEGRDVSLLYSLKRNLGDKYSHKKKKACVHRVKG